MQPQEYRQQRDQHQVHAHEPQRADDEQHRFPDPLQIEDGAERNAERNPHTQQGERRNSQPAHATQHELVEVLPFGLSTAPGHQV